MPTCKRSGGEKVRAERSERRVDAVAMSGGGGWMRALESVTDAWMGSGGAALELPMEDMKKKLIELAKANEELVNKNTELLGKLKKADSQIIELEKERRADKNQIDALKKQLHKEAKHAQTK
ncbi:hypothetical protein ACLB2K_055252 [Fragaria x ananassa]